MGFYVRILKVTAAILVGILFAYPQDQANAAKGPLKPKISNVKIVSGNDSGTLTVTSNSAVRSIKFRTSVNGSSLIHTLNNSYRARVSKRSKNYRWQIKSPQLAGIIGGTTLKLKLRAKSRRHTINRTVNVAVAADPDSPVLPAPDRTETFTEIPVVNDGTPTEPESEWPVVTCEGVMGNYLELTQAQAWVNTNFSGEAKEPQISLAIHKDIDTTSLATITEIDGIASGALLSYNHTRASPTLLIWLSDALPIGSLQVGEPSLIKFEVSGAGSCSVTVTPYAVTSP